MTKTLRVDLADLEGIPHASGPSGTSVTVTAEYTSPVILEADGKIILAPKSKTMGAAGRVDFTGIYTSDSEEVREDHRGFAVRVKVDIREPNGATRTWARTVKPLEHMADTIRLGRLPSAEGLPAQWVSVGEVIGAANAAAASASQAATDASTALAQVGPAATTAAQAAAAPAVTAAEAAKTQAQSAATSAQTSATLAQQAQAAALEVPDANVSALIGNPATETRAAADGVYARGQVDLSSMAGTGSTTWDTNSTRVGHPDLTLITGPAADSLIVGGGHKGSDYTSPNEIQSTDALYRLMTIVGGYDSTVTDALASTAIAPMHAHIHAGSTHAGIFGGSYQNLHNVDYGGAILGTANTVGLDGVAQSGWHAISIGGKDNNVSADGGTTGGYPTIINSLASTVRSTTEGDPDINGGRYAAIVGGIQNTNQGNASGQLAGQANRIGDDVVDPGSTGSHSGQVGGYLNKVTTGRYAGQVGGYQLTASGDRAGQLGGTLNNAAGLGTGTLAGFQNTVTGQYTGVAGGSNHNVQSGAHFSGVVGGSAHTLTHRFTGALGGRDSTLSGENAVTLGGRRHIVNGQNSSAQGVGARTRIDGLAAYAYGWFAAEGDAQSFVAQLRREYAGGAAAAMYLNDGLGGGDRHLVMPDNSVWRFSAEVVGRCASSGEAIGGTITGTIKRGASAASTALVGTPVVVDQKDNAAWNITATANTTQGSLQIQGQHGDGAKTLRWTARLTITEIVY